MPSNNNILFWYIFSLYFGNSISLKMKSFRASWKTCIYFSTSLSDAVKILRKFSVFFLSLKVSDRKPLRNCTSLKSFSLLFSTQESIFDAISNCFPWYLSMATFVRNLALLSNDSLYFFYISGKGLNCSSSWCISSTSRSYLTLLCRSMGAINSCILNACLF